ncbi:MAG: DUF4116 domain-containing protein [Pseudomonadota bacterium]
MKRIFAILFILLLAPQQLYAASISSFVEYYLLQKFPKNITRNGDEYTIRANSGKIIKMQNCNDLVGDKCEGDNWKYYSLQDVIDNRYVIFELRGQHYEVTDLNLGNQIITRGFPNFSPDRTRIIAVEANEMDGSSIDLYEMKNGKYQLVFEKGDGEYYLPEFHSWKNNDVIRIEDEHWIEDKTVPFGQRMGVVNMVLSYNKKTAKWECKKTNKKFPIIKTDEEVNDFEKRFPDIRSFFTDKKLVLSMLKGRETNVKYISKKLFDDAKVMRAAVKSNIGNVQYISPRLAGDVNFMTSLLEIDTYTFKYASEKLRDDRDFVLKALSWKSRDPNANFLFVSKRLQDDEELLKIVLSKNNGQVLVISPRIQDKLGKDKEFAIQLINISCRIFSHFSDQLKSDKGIRFAAENACKTQRISFEMISGEN